MAHECAPAAARRDSRRRGAGEAARRGVSVTFLAYGYSCTQRAVFRMQPTRARRRALMTRGARAGRSVRGARRAASIATFAARTRVELARRARRFCRDGGRGFLARIGIVPPTDGFSTLPRG